jgi:hypothetical protein
MKALLVKIDQLDSITAALNQLRDIFASRDTEDSYRIQLDPGTPCSDEINSIKDFLVAKNYPIDDEALVCLTAAQYPQLRDQMIELITDISHYNQFDTKHALLLNYETPFGFHLAFALALHDEQQVIYWTAFIKGLDLNHEAHEAVAMEVLFEVHGITTNTLDLAVERCLIPSQFGIDQVKEWLGPVKEHPVCAEFIKRLADSTCESFIEDSSTHQSKSRARLNSMNLFLSEFYAD